MDNKKMIEELEKIPKSKWAKMWCEMNSWGCPKELEHIKPKDFNKLKQEQVSEFISPLMRKIESEIGFKKCNREWNIDIMTDEQHEEFWNKNF